MKQHKFAPDYHPLCVTCEFKAICKLSERMAHIVANFKAITENFPIEAAIGLHFNCSLRREKTMNIKEDNAFDDCILEGN